LLKKGQFFTEMGCGCAIRKPGKTMSEPRTFGEKKVTFQDVGGDREKGVNYNDVPRGPRGQMFIKPKPRAETKPSAPEVDGQPQVSPSSDLRFSFGEVLKHQGISYFSDDET